MFEEKRFTLEELVNCLKTNWGRQTEFVGSQLGQKIAYVSGVPGRQGQPLHSPVAALGRQAVTRATAGILLYALRS